MQRFSASQTGFTLIELMVAAAGFVVLMLIALQFMSSSNFLTGRNDLKIELLALKNLIAGTLSIQANCDALFAGQSFSASAAPGAAGQPVVLDLRAPDKGGIGLIQEPSTVLPNFKLQITESRLWNAQEANTITGMPTDRFFTVWYAITATSIPKIGESLVTFKRQTIQSIIVRTNLAADKILSCQSPNFSYRKRCANYGMIYMPSGFGTTISDSNGCVPLSALGNK